MKLNDEEEWLYGPTFHICIAFLDKKGITKSHDNSIILKALNIEGPWDDPMHAGDSSLRIADWATHQISYGLWNIHRDHVLNVKIILSSFRRYHYHLLLSIPPKSMSKHYKGYSWSIKSNWVTPSVTAFHKHVMIKCRQLHKHKMLKIVYLWQEDWSQTVRDDAKGFVIYNDIAATAGMKGIRISELYCNIPF